MSFIRCDYTSQELQGRREVSTTSYNELGAYYPRPLTGWQSQENTGGVQKVRMDV
jgi:hypothetical protein